jgi:hypothetical protein
VSTGGVSGAQREPSRAVEEKKPAATSDEFHLPPGVSEVIGIDDARRRILLRLFNPNGLLKLLHPILQSFRHLIYLLPLVLVTSFFVLSNHGGCAGRSCPSTF